MTFSELSDSVQGGDFDRHPTGGSSGLRLFVACASLCRWGACPGRNTYSEYISPFDYPGPYPVSNVVGKPPAMFYIAARRKHSPQAGGVLEQGQLYRFERPYRTVPQRWRCTAYDEDVGASVAGGRL